MTWVPVLPALLVAALLLTVPGLLVGLALGLRNEPSLGAAPLLSVVTVALAIPLSSVLGLEWGLLPIAATTAVLVLGGLLCWWLARRFLPATAVAARRDPPRSARLDLLTFSITAVAGAAWVGAVCIHTIGDVATVQQTFDGVFHVNAIARVAETGSASPGTVSATSNTTGAAPFYPPLFHALGGLLVAWLGLTPVVAANVLAVVVAAVVWVLSMALLGHVVLARRRLGVAACVLAACAMPVFPYLLMSFGVLWPNLLSVAVLPTVLAFVVVVLGESEVPTIPWATSLVGGVLSLAGLYYAHPGGVFAAVALALPVLASSLVSLGATVWRRRPLGPFWAVLGAVLVVVALRVAWNLVLSVPQVQSTMKFDWRATMTMAQAFGNALALATPLSPASWLLAWLVVGGAALAIRHRHQRWLVLAHAVVVYLYMLAAGSDEQTSQELTGFWYNDQYRLAALLPITGAPLAGLALVRCRDLLLRALSLWRHRRGSHQESSNPGRRGPDILRWGAAGAVLAVVVLLLPGQWRLVGPAYVLRGGYYPGSDASELIDQPERQLYARLLAPAPGDEALVIGDPWTGGALAGPISGREGVYGHMINRMDPDRELLSTRFRELATDRAVCAAVRRLGIGYAVEDTRHFRPDDPRTRTYPGIDGLAGRPGLELLGRDGTVSVYRVLPCQT